MGDHCDYVCLGDVNEADEYNARCLRIQLAILGEMHPSTAAAYVARLLSLPWPDCRENNRHIESD